MISSRSNKARSIFLRAVDFKFTVLKLEAYSSPTEGCAGKTMKVRSVSVRPVSRAARCEIIRF